MRPTNSNTQAYQPGEPPSDPAQLPLFLRVELIKLKAAIDAVSEGFLPPTYASPAKPREGMLRMADGTQWNPGSGKGLYRFNGSTWVFVG